MADSSSPQKIKAEQNAVRKALDRNRKRRARAGAEVKSARAEFAALLARGDEATLPVAEMARLAGVSRETAHKVLRNVRRR